MRGDVGVNVPNFFKELVDCGDKVGVAVAIDTIVEDGGGVLVMVDVIAIMVVMGIVVDIVVVSVVDTIVDAGTVVGIDVVEGGVEDIPTKSTCKICCQLDNRQVIDKSLQAF